jgi:hypothetical protein
MVAHTVALLGKAAPTQEHWKTHQIGRICAKALPVPAAQNVRWLTKKDARYAKDVIQCVAIPIL